MKRRKRKKRGYEYKTKHTSHSARNITRKIGREELESIHIRHRLIETTGNQTRNGLGGDQGHYWQSAKVGDSHSAFQVGMSPLVALREIFQEHKAKTQSG